MQIVLSIDDTDTLGTPGSGQLAEDLALEIHLRGLGRCDEIVRHQLFVHEAVPFTSHNSSMSFTAEIEEERLDEVISLGRYFLQTESAEGSDPGLCVAVRDERLDRDSLISFGCRTKREIVAKESAYALAARLGIHLSEHGGTGDGVIGALAGVGLRLQGSDGRFRGWFKEGKRGEWTTAGKLAAAVGARCVDQESGTPVAEDMEVRFGDDRVKPVMMAGEKVIPLVKAAGGGVQIYWATLTKEGVKRF